MVTERAMVRLLPPAGDDVSARVAELREIARARYTEVDLLVAALREHIADLRTERDRLVGEVERLRARLDVIDEDRRRLSSTWLFRGQKGPRPGQQRPRPGA